MGSIVRDFLDTLLEYATPLVATFNKGATEEELADFEAEMGVRLPAVVREMYMMFNGQRAGDNDVFFLDGLRFLPLGEIKVAQRHWQELLEEVSDLKSLSFDKEEAIDMGWHKVIRNQFYDGKWLPFLTNGARFLFIDLNPDKNGRLGQIAEIDLLLHSVKESFMDIQASSLEDWLEDLIERIEVGIVYYDEERHSLVDSSLYVEDGLGIPNFFAPEPDYISGGGSNVYHYSDENLSDWVIPDRENVYCDEICAHFERYIGKEEGVFRDLKPEYVHIDVHWIAPTPDRPYHVLFTTGMSDYPMYLPQNLEDPNDYSYAELMVYLPEDWKIGDEAFEDFNNYWPIYFMKMLARFPHQYKTWMGEGHTIPNGNDAAPIANTDFGCLLLLPPYTMEDKDFLKLTTEDGTTINFYAIIPIYNEEMEVKLEKGLEPLLLLFDNYKVKELIDTHRRNVALDK